MKKSARSFTCDFTGTVFDDPRCKIDHCVPEKELNAKHNSNSAVAQAPFHRDIQEAARRFAKEILKAKKIKATPEMIAKVMKLPAVLHEARRRVDWLNNSS